ncbi:zinc ABC transporter substrate-binding protein ZnuA [Rhizobiaceae bacterium n13]|uniref:High-affinity zinc uptake system protein ZnuA n=1 Tax=Ferirhizobium litorale TaxID=2927786 RepID=A0AAE3U394_9HYPH|nr:zinc ABC transporter substrate-binding protein ZnuA [Fererhizobium litorale]MDI7863532.1 zinc ABC transporter substrate-binding protein ZnuA [Fererhizobium litorale]MDI7923547.1 zinc ABC transporter substrate-binding protein ZnuA [Fererhizobium litorale]
MKKASCLLFASSILALSATAQAADAPDVVVSIKPLHSLVAAVMAGVGTPELIVDGGASPHTYSLKPSNARALEQADVVFWAGPGLEAFLEKPLGSLAAKAKVVELSEAPGLTLLPFREGGAFEAHDHGHEGEEGHAEEAHAHEGEEAHEGEHAHVSEHAHEDEHADGHEGHADHDHEGHDMHVWLDPVNAKAMTAEIAATLAAADPANAERYEANAEKLEAKLDALDQEIAATVSPVKDKPFVVFHDAYQYLEKRYGLKVAGSITISPENVPGAERVAEIHKKVIDLGATCVFAEPQFEPKLVGVVLEGTPAKSGTLDPEGATLQAGPELYFELMRGTASSLKDCLSGN